MPDKNEWYEAGRRDERQWLLNTPLGPGGQCMADHPIAGGDDEWIKGYRRALADVRALLASRDG